MRSTRTWIGSRRHDDSGPPVTPGDPYPGDPYPRDLEGYGAHPPHPQWPGDANIAVSIVLNVEEGGESCVLHGDRFSESVLTDVGAVPLEDARNMNVESMFEYGSRVGFWQVLRMLDERRARATIYAVGMALERNPAAAEALARSSFEVACHGQRWIDYQFVSEAKERADMLQNIEIITRLIGRRPVGWYTGRPSQNTRRLVVETGGFLYDSDAYNDDLPYWTRVGDRAHLVVPHSFDTNDSRLQRGGDFATGEDFFVYCRDAFDWLYRQGADGRPRMMTISLHGRIIGRPGRIGALARLLDHIQRHGAVWLCSREDIARHWIADHPAPAQRASP
jgi:allantoinase